MERPLACLWFAIATVAMLCVLVTCVHLRATRPAPSVMQQRSLP